MKQLQVISLPVSHLRLGMYVCELDCSWLQTPFMLQGILLKNEDDLLTLQSLCRRVSVDVHKSRLTPQEIEVARLVEQIVAPRYPLLSNMPEELLAASVAQRKALDDIEVMLAEISAGKPLRSADIVGSLRDCLDSIVRNPSAMLWLARIKHADRYTAEHCLNVAILAMNFGRHLGLSRLHLEWLGLCGMLHDVGKMQVPADLLNKPGRLTAEEFEVVKRHAEQGYEALRDDPDLPPTVLAAVRSHHERMDAKGYPQQLPPDQIGFFTRITSIVDAYDAITSQRCYSPAQSSDRALNILYANRGTQFDEMLVIRFIESVGVYPPGVPVELSSGEVAVVIANNPQWRLLPKVAVVGGNPASCHLHRIVDLATELALPAEKRLRIVRALAADEIGLDLEAFAAQTLNALR